MVKAKKEPVFWMDIPAVEPPEYLFRFWDNKSGCHLDKIRIHRRTKLGAWLCTAKPNGLQAFVLNEGKKKYAYPTIELAKESFLARKRWQLGYLKATVSRVEEAVKAMNEGELVLFDKKNTDSSLWHVGYGQMVLPSNKAEFAFPFDSDEDHKNAGSKDPGDLP